MNEVLLAITIGVLGVSLVLLIAFSVEIAMDVAERVSKKINKEHQNE